MAELEPAELAGLVAVVAMVDEREQEQEADTDNETEAEAEAEKVEAELGRLQGSEELLHQAVPRALPRSDW